MVLETERLLIRPITEDDWPSVKAIREDFHQSTYAQYDRPMDTEKTAVRERISRWAKANRGTEHMFFAVCLQSVLIGYIAFNRREDGYEIGYCFHSAYHGKGYAGESIQALISYLHSLGVRKISAGTAINNLPSVRLLQSLGFKQTGEEKVSFYKDADENGIFFDGGIFERSI